jgi:hypothetical protein
MDLHFRGDDNIIFLFYTPFDWIPAFAGKTKKIFENKYIVYFLLAGSKFI